MGVTDPMAVARKPGLRERLGIPTDALVIGAFGGITAEKRVPQILGAVASVGQRERPVHVLLAGQRAAHYDLDADVRKFGLDRRVHVAGYVPDEDLRFFLSSADALVMASFYEGFGLPALEAMACGAPVIAADAGALPEVVGDAGLLFDPRSVSALTGTLGRVLGDDELRRDMSRRGLARAAEFNWQASARAALAAFEELAR